MEFHPEHAGLQVLRNISSLNIFSYIYQNTQSKANRYSIVATTKHVLTKKKKISYPT